MLLALVPSILSYRELSSVRKRLKPVELATDITKVFLEVRKNEKTFLLLKDPNSLQLLDCPGSCDWWLYEGIIFPRWCREMAVEQFTC